MSSLAIPLPRGIPLPRKMRALQRDARGYPVPFVVARDERGRPLFAVNDILRQRRALTERRCPICGTRLGSLLWFLGGPLSAFHPNGGYLDTAMHRECMEYALKVCPYLATPNYAGKADPEKVRTKFGNGVVVTDPTMSPGRPALFVAVAAKKQTMRLFEIGIGHRAIPERPYLAVEYWLNGERISLEEALPLIPEEVRAAAC